MIRTAFILIVSYACAALVSSHVSMDLAQTDWTSLWVYFWWALAAPMLGMFWIGIVTALLAWWSR